jgi:hypothetical protein
VDAIDGTDIHASGVFCADAGLSDYVSHSNLLCSDNRPSAVTWTQAPGGIFLYHAPAGANKQLE